MNEKLAEFLNKTLVSINFTDHVLRLEFDRDGDPNTETVDILTISHVDEDDIQCD